VPIVVLQTFSFLSTNPTLSEEKMKQERRYDRKGDHMRERENIRVEDRRRRRKKNK